MLKTRKSATTATYLPRVTHSKPASCGGAVNVAVFLKTLVRARAREVRNFLRDASIFHRDARNFHRDARNFHRDTRNFHRDTRIFNQDARNFSRDARNFQRDGKNFPRDGKNFPRNARNLHVCFSGSCGSDGLSLWTWRRTIPAGLVLMGKSTLTGTLCRPVICNPAGIMRYLRDIVLF